MVVGGGRGSTTVTAWRQWRWRWHGDSGRQHGEGEETRYKHWNGRGVAHPPVWQVIIVADVPIWGADRCFDTRRVYQVSSSLGGGVGAHACSCLWIACERHTHQPPDGDRARCSMPCTTACAIPLCCFATDGVGHSSSTVHCRGPPTWATGVTFCVTQRRQTAPSHRPCRHTGPCHTQRDSTRRVGGGGFCRSLGESGPHPHLWRSVRQSRGSELSAMRNTTTLLSSPPLFAYPTLRGPPGSSSAPRRAP